MPGPTSSKTPSSAYPRERRRSECGDPDVHAGQRLMMQLDLGVPDQFLYYWKARPSRDAENQRRVKVLLRSTQS